MSSQRNRVTDKTDERQRAKPHCPTLCSSRKTAPLPSARHREIPVRDPAADAQSRGLDSFPGDDDIVQSIIRPPGSHSGLGAPLGPLPLILLNLVLSFQAALRGADYHDVAEPAGGPEPSDGGAGLPGQHLPGTYGSEKASAGPLQSAGSPKSTWYASIDILIVLVC